MSLKQSIQMGTDNGFIGTGADIDLVVNVNRPGRGDGSESCFTLHIQSIRICWVCPISRIMDSDADGIWDTYEAGVYDPDYDGISGFGVPIVNSFGVPVTDAQWRFLGECGCSTRF